MQLLQSVSDGFEEKDKEVRVAAEIGQMLVEKNKQLIEQMADVEAQCQLKVRPALYRRFVPPPRSHQALIEYLLAREEGGRAPRRRPEAEGADEAHRRAAGGASPSRVSTPASPRWPQRSTEEIGLLEARVTELKAQVKDSMNYKAKTQQLFDEVRRPSFCSLPRYAMMKSLTDALLR